MARKKKQVETEFEDIEIVEAEEVAPKPKMVTITLQVPIWINGKRYSGKCIVSEDLARDLIPIAQKKMASDLAVMTGKNFLVKRAADNALRIVEIQE